MPLNTILFVFIPFKHETTSIAQMPFAFEGAYTLSRYSKSLCLITWTKVPYSLNRAQFPYIIHKKLFDASGRIHSHLDLLLKTCQVAINILKYRPLIVCTVGQKGALIGFALKKFFRFKLVCFNDELPSGYSSCYTEFEKRSLCNADLIVLPDLRRAPLLLNEIRAISSDIRFSQILNLNFATPKASVVDSVKQYLFGTMGLSTISQIVLYAGGLGEWALTPELLESSQAWPKNYILLLHSPSFDSPDDAIQTGSLDNVYSSTRLLEPDELSALYQLSFASLALYRNSGSNISSIGLSAGKICQSLYSVTPVICSTLPSLDFIQAYNLGCLVQSPYDIVDALSRIQVSRHTICKNIVRFKNHYMRRSLQASSFCKSIESLNDAIGDDF